MTLEERRALAAMPVTLDGEPAVISGVLCPFASVRQVRTGQGFDWNWDAVARVVAAGGDFRS